MFRKSAPLRHIPVEYKDVDENIVAWRARLDSNVSELSPTEYLPDFHSLYRDAQFKIAMGYYEEAIPVLTQAFSIMASQSLKDSFEWKGIYFSIGGLLATSLDYLGKVDLAEEVFNSIIKDDPIGNHICDYAVFLHRRKRDYEKANSFYLKAIETFPGSSFAALKYAGFLRHVRRDNKNAEKYYKLACEKNPENSEALGAYASFLHGASTNVPAAEAYYEKAIKVDPTHTNNLCNMGLFLRCRNNNYLISFYLVNNSFTLVNLYV